MDFKQANLAVPQSAEHAFSDEGSSFDYVFNLAAETKYGQSPDVSNTIYHHVRVLYLVTLVMSSRYTRSVC